MNLQSPVSRRALLVGTLLVGALALASGVRAANLAGSLGWYDDQNEPRRCDELTAANPGLTNPAGGDPCAYDAREDQQVGYDSLPVCQDSVDNDSDELTDCLDPDCFADPSCGGGEWCNIESAQFAGQEGDCGGDDGVNKCQDGLDNDSDGLFDCSDPDCAYGQGTWSEVCRYIGDPTCPEYTCYAGSMGQDEWQCGGDCSAERCGDGIDNDGNGEYDCADQNCMYRDACQTMGENDEQRCSDGQDNDRDGSYDCSDPDCAGTSTCWWAWSGWNPVNWLSSYETDCGNGADDDGDGYYDCSDSDCSADYRCNASTNPVSVETSPWGYFSYDFCSNTDGNGQPADDDYDGYANCDDPDCQSAPNCTPRPCAPTEQDADGNCELDYEYYGPTCADPYDNDQDGLMNCDDSDCSLDPSCAPGGAGRVGVSEITPDGVQVNWLFGNGYCVDGVDGDSNGWTDCWDDACNNQDPACLVFTGFGTEGWPYDWRYENGDPRAGGNGHAGGPGAVSRCGDGSCGAGESCDNCSADCGTCGGPGGNVSCGNGTCDSDESCTSCQADCGTCGDGGGEERCGDGVCSGFETCGSCAYDCGECNTRIVESPDCSDGQDNDGDGSTDCGDPDCSSSESCWGPGPLTNCSVAEEILRNAALDYANTLQEISEKFRQESQNGTMTPARESELANEILKAGNDYDLAAARARNLCPNGAGN